MFCFDVVAANAAVLRDDAGIDLSDLEIARG
jgi:hypothetical protein